VVSFLEMGSDGGDLVDQILNLGDSVSSELLSDDTVVLDGDSLSVYSGITSLIDQFSDGLSGGETKSDERENLLEHVGGSLVDADEGGVVDLSQSEQTEDLRNIGVELLGTSDSDDQGELGLSGDVELSLGSGGSLVGDFEFLGIKVLLLISLRSLQPFGLTLNILSVSGFSPLGFLRL